MLRTGRSSNLNPALRLALTLHGMSHCKLFFARHTLVLLPGSAACRTHWQVLTAQVLSLIFYWTETVQGLVNC